MSVSVNSASLTQTRLAGRVCVSGCGLKGFSWSVRTEHFTKVIFQTRVMCFGSFLPFDRKPWRIGELVKRVSVAGIDEVSQYRFLMLPNVTPCHSLSRDPGLCLIVVNYCFLFKLGKAANLARSFHVQHGSEVV